MISEESYDLGYEAGAADMDKTWRSLLDKIASFDDSEVVEKLLKILEEC